MAVAVAHDEVGSGPPVVLSCSLGTTMAAWGPQRDLLAERHRTITYDHRGHGRSPVPDGPYAIADLATDALGLLDRLELQRVAFVGTSLGGMVGMWLAANAPERIDRLVLVCTAAHLAPAGAWHDRASLVRSEGPSAVVERVTGRWFTPSFRSARADVVARFAAELAATPAEGYAGCCEAIAAMDLRADLERIAAPTLVVAGEHDPATTVADATLIADAIDGARLAVVSTAHLANVEDPATVTGLILEHLS